MKNKKEQVCLFWFRRDLRLEDNRGLAEALKSGHPVLPIFIFDTGILEKLKDPADARVTFIHKSLELIDQELREIGSGLLVVHGDPLAEFKKLSEEWNVRGVYTNRDYEPEAIERDRSVSEFWQSQGVSFHSSKDQCLFEKKEILSQQNTPYTVFTPYKKKVLSVLTAKDLRAEPSWSETAQKHYLRWEGKSMPSLKEMGFKESSLALPQRVISASIIRDYDKTRDFPANESGTTRLGIHLRFGTLSVRKLAAVAQKSNQTYLSELIWRDFFMQILYNFPHVVKSSFRREYDEIEWRQDEEALQRWKEGQTGFPLVDAGMRELNQTGYMHNRVRMVTASFLCKHLLTYWYEGERYFAEKLLDYDLSANNGNWQWAAGSGCDAAPYFRVFNPSAQQKRFDSRGDYVRKWVPELDSDSYPEPIVDHTEARNRALEVYRRGLDS